MKNSSKLYLESFSGEKTEIEEIDFSNVLSSEHKKLLREHDGAITFTNGARFKIKRNKRPQVSDSDGWVSVDFLFGLGTDTNSLSFNNMNKPEELEDVTIIGGVQSGDFICIKNDNGSVYYWYHESFNEDESLFYLSKDFSEFFNNLEPDEKLDPEVEKRVKGIVKCDLGFLKNL
ncbi:SMI1/KNR4 family protein [Budvicia aquatica]|nr:SMI1/KNR4 family protein [Budvicia aquatica]VFS51564.1 Uncharacterised protein [Budvicia aquatica]